MARGGRQGEQPGEPTDWVTRAADDAVRHAGEGAGVDKPITCASGVLAITSDTSFAISP